MLTLLDIDFIIIVINIIKKLGDKMKVFSRKLEFKKVIKKI